MKPDKCLLLKAVLGKKKKKEKQIRMEKVKGSTHPVDGWAA